MIQFRSAEPDPPGLSAILGGFYEGWEESYLDPGQAVDAGAAQLVDHEGGLDSAMRRLRDLVASAGTDEELREQLYDFGVSAALPEGNSWRVWSRRVLERLEAVAADPGLLGREDFRARYPDTASFPDVEAANDAATEVLRANEARLRAWGADTEGWWRLHLYADLGRVVGTVREHRTGDLPPAEQEPVTAAVVVMKLNFRTGEPYIMTAYPTRPLDEAVRVRLPDLCHLFGGYFGPDWPAEDGTVWQAQHNFQASTRSPARDRVRDQLGDLLELDDTGLAHALTALGSAVVPAVPRPWVARMRWRLDAFDWRRAAADAGGRDPG